MCDQVHLVLYQWGRDGTIEHPCYDALWHVVTEKLKLYDPHRGKSWAKREIELYNEILQSFGGVVVWQDPTIMKAQFRSQQDLTAFVLAWT